MDQTMDRSTKSGKKSSDKMDKNAANMSSDISTDTSSDNLADSSMTDTMGSDTMSADASSGKMAAMTDKVGTLARDAKNTVTDVMGRVQGQIPAGVTDQFNSLKDQSQVVLDRTEDLVRKYPLYSILGAAAVGAFFGSMMSGRSSSRSYKH